MSYCKVSTAILCRALDPCARGLGYAMAENGEPNGIIQAAFSEGAQGSNTMKSITLDALQKEAQKRPTAAEVHRRLEEVMEEMLFWIKEAPAYYCKIS